MGRLIIETNDQEALEIIKNFAEKKKVKVVEVKENISNSPVDILLPGKKKSEMIGTLLSTNDVFFR